MHAHSINFAQVFRGEAEPFFLVCVCVCVCVCGGGGGGGGHWVEISLVKPTPYLPQD